QLDSEVASQQSASARLRCDGLRRGPRTGGPVWWNPFSTIRRPLLWRHVGVGWDELDSEEPIKQSTAARFLCDGLRRCPRSSGPVRRLRWQLPQRYVGVGWHKLDSEEPNE